MPDKQHMSFLVEVEIQHWFRVACQLRKRKMTAVLVEYMRLYASEVLKENHMPDPFKAHPAPPASPHRGAKKKAGK